MPGVKRELQSTGDVANTAKRRKSDGTSEKPKHDKPKDGYKAKDGYKSKDGFKSKDGYKPKDGHKPKDGEKKPHIVPQLLDCTLLRDAAPPHPANTRLQRNPQPKHTQSKER